MLVLVKMNNNMDSVKNAIQEKYSMQINIQVRLQIVINYIIHTKYINFLNYYIYLKLREA